jgi:NAD(P)-dependent dehydrogenase (short-subunit alcohol dehydrogenase family)
MSRSVLITGCSTGIGRACAVELAARGHRVVATARRVGDLADLDVDLKLALDVTDDESVAAAVEQAGDIDVLVNNAGITAWAPVELLGPGLLARVLDTNVVGVARVTSAVLPAMRERRRGTIVNVSSAAALRGFPLLGAYAASKAALEAWTETLRLELSSFGISVALVEPGGVESAFAANRITVDVDAEYRPLWDRAVHALTGMRSEPISAAEVAEAIASIVADEHAPLRNPVGDVAVRILAERHTVGDAAYEAMVQRALGETS